MPNTIKLHNTSLQVKIIEAKYRLSLNREQITVGAIDVGAPHNIGWAILSGGEVEHGANLDEFIVRFAKLSEGGPSALGFEAPLFIPHGRPLNKLTAQRQRREWSPVVSWCRCNSNDDWLGNCWSCADQITRIQSQETCCP